MSLPLDRGFLGPRARNRLGTLSGLLGLGAAVVLAGCDGAASSQTVRPNPASSEADAVHALASLEPATGLLTIGARPGARIEAIKVQPGDAVKAGDLLAVLEGHDQAEKQLALAEAQKKSADHQRALQRSKLALEREAQDRLKGPRLDAAKRMNDLTQQRQKQVQLVLPKLTTMAEKDERSKFDLAQNVFQIEVAATRADLELKELQAELDLQPKRRALEDEGAADDSPEARVLTRQIDLARAAVADAEVHAPSPGRVLELLARPGEVSGGPLLSLGDVSTMVAKAEVFQSDVPRLAPGDPAEVSVLGKSVAGKVTRIGQLVGGNALRSIDPRALQDLRVVKVTIALDDAAEASRLVNMQVDVTIRPGSRARGPGGP